MKLVTEQRDWCLKFFDANKPEARTRVHNPPTRWAQPKNGLYKVNYDAAIFDSLGYAGLGVVIRDSARQIIATLSQKIGCLIQWKQLKLWLHFELSCLLKN